MSLPLYKITVSSLAMPRPESRASKPGPVDEAPRHGILQVLLPVELDRTLDVPLVVGAGVLGYLDRDDAGVIEVRLHPVGVRQHVRQQPPGWACRDGPGRLWLAWLSALTHDQYLGFSVVIIQV